MGYYPVFIEMDQRPGIVIGGGVVAERKVEGLLSNGAIVMVISPALTERLASLAQEGKIRHLARKYQVGDLQGYEIAFVATDDRETNAAVFREGREQGVWINAADNPSHCDFILPSVLRRGDLVVAVATGGSSPALSRAIREELEAYFTEDYAMLAEIAAEVRLKLRERSVTPTAEAWQKALNGDLRRLIKEGKREEAKVYLLKRLGAEI